MPANSYTIRDLVPEIIKKKPDLILIYLGHNEYYGALGIGSVESLGTSRFLVNTTLWFNKFKSVELLRNIINSDFINAMELFIRQCQIFIQKDLRVF